MTDNLRDDPTLAGVVDENTPDELIDPTLLFAKTARDAMIATGDRHLPELVLLAARSDAVLALLVELSATVHGIPDDPPSRGRYVDTLRTSVEETALDEATRQLDAVIEAFTPPAEQTPAVTLDDLLAAAQDPAGSAYVAADVPRLTPDEFYTVRRFEDSPAAFGEPTP
jgi:hypothetical protein